MMNQFSSLELGKRALDYFRRGMETSGHNIANADVEGYSRQRVEASTTEPFTTPGMSRPWVYGQIGTGVKVDAIVRMRDAFLDAQFDEESTVLGYWDQIQQVLRTSELYVNEPNGTGFEVSVNEFWAALQEASKRPDDASVRMDLVEKTRTLTVMMDQLVTNYDQYRAALNQEVNLTVQEVNTLIDEIAQLNVTISEIEGVGWNPNDLYDARDLKVSQLSKLINCTPATLCDMEDGQFKLYLDGKLIVQGEQTRHLVLVKIAGNGGYYDVQLEDNEFDPVSDLDVAEVIITQQAPEAVHMLTVDRLAREVAWSIGGADSITDGGSRLVVEDPEEALDLCGIFDIQISSQGVQVRSKAITSPPAGAVGELLTAPAAGDRTEYAFRIAAGDTERILTVEWADTLVPGTYQWEISDNAGNGPLGYGPELNITELQNFVNTNYTSFLHGTVNTTGTVLTLDSLSQNHISITDIKGDLMESAGLGDTGKTVSIQVNENDTLQTIANKINGAYNFTPPEGSDITFTDGAPDSPEEWLHASVEQDGNGEFYLKLTSNVVGEQHRINLRGDSEGNLTVLRRLGLLQGAGGNDTATAFQSMARDAYFVYDNVHYLSSSNAFTEARRISAADGYDAATLEVVSPGIAGSPPNHYTYPPKLSDGVAGIHFFLKGKGTTEITCRHHVKGGELFALLEGRDDILLESISTFDEIVFSLVSEMNAVHYAGHGTGDYENTTGTQFFLPVSVQYGASRNFSINEMLSLYSGLLGFASDDGQGKTAGQGDGSNALNMAQLKQAQIMGGGSYTVNSFYEGFVAQLGAQAKRANTMQDNQETLVIQIDNQRQSIMGVNIDEEMIDIVKFQQAFNAMARMITTTDEMLDKVINGMGIVGR
jgi:flagellar hook-associated protein 1 FlgK